MSGKYDKLAQACEESSTLGEAAKKLNMSLASLREEVKYARHLGFRIKRLADVAFSDAQFAEIWNAAESPQQVADRLHVEIQVVQNAAARCRRHGLILKRIKKGPK